MKTDDCGSTQSQSEHADAAFRQGDTLHDCSMTLEDGAGLVTVWPTGPGGREVLMGRGLQGPWELHFLS